ncbi:MAG: hypothetical protein JXB85_18315 [Anaerolineales bacterium]|nr:hypothetical protein [Anaerolineales bacterium]
MNKPSILHTFKHIFSPPRIEDVESRQRVATLYFLLWVLVIVCFGLMVLILLRGEERTFRGLLVAAIVLIASLVLTRLGRFAIPRSLVPTAILLVNLYILYFGLGLHDLGILGLAMNIALAGLLLGKRGVVAFTLLSSLGLTGIYVAEIYGLLVMATPFRDLTSLGDLVIMITLLLTTGVFIYIAMHTLARNLEMVRDLNNELEGRVIARTAELQAANEHLTALSQVKDDFVSNVSHELRTPLTSIKLYLGMLQRKPDQARQVLDRLSRETGRLEHLIESLLALSRLDQERVAMLVSPLDLNRLAEQLIIDRAPLAADRRLDLHLELQADLPLVQADERMVGEVLSILLTNALEYTPAGGQVTVRTCNQGGQQDPTAGFAVIDTGPGITPEDLAHIFERFFRGKAGRESKIPGTGLGLAIAREIVNRHNGRIEVHSEGQAGQGAIFHVWLPVSDST